jgi:hypothetical protein
MGGGNSPGTQNSFQTQQTTSTSEPNSFVQPWLKQIGGYFGDFLNKNPTAPSLYGDSFTVKPSEATQAAQQAYKNIGIEGLGYGIEPANRNLTSQTLGGAFLDPGTNPYLQKYLRAGFDTQNEAFNDTVIPGLRSQFAGSGRNLGGADIGTVERATKNLGRTQANAAAGAEAGAYGDERGRQLQTQSMLPSFQGMDLARAGALGQAGQMQDVYAQKLRDEAIYRDTYGKTGNLDYWSNMASRLLGAYPGGTTSGSGNSSGYQQYMPPSNGLASGMGGLMGLAGLGMQAYALSDARLKKDITPVGKLNDGQTIYSYRFPGNPKTEIGLLAQEVERVHPEAVATHPSGYKMVDYRRVTAAPGGLM